MYIQYLDANNLYGAALCETLPTKDFRWLTEDEVEDLELYAKAFIPFPEGVGCTLDVDLDYPEELQELHNQCGLSRSAIGYLPNKFTK